jgi:hypothetical protein
VAVLSFGELSGGEGIEFEGRSDREVGFVIGHGNKYYFISLTFLSLFLSYTIPNFLVIPLLRYMTIKLSLI